MHLAGIPVHHDIEVGFLFGVLIHHVAELLRQKGQLRAVLLRKLVGIAEGADGILDFRDILPVDLLEFRGKNIADHYYLLAKALYRLTNGSWLFADSSALDYLSRLCVKVLVKSSNIYGGCGDNRLHLLRPYLLGSLVGNELCAVIRHIRLDALYHLVKLLLAYGALSIENYLDADTELIIYHS